MTREAADDSAALGVRLAALGMTKASALRAALPRPVHAFTALGAVTLTQVVDTVYRADGTAAQGTLLISWPGFTTASGQAVAAGSLSVRLGADGSFSAGLAANTGSTPTGTYYRVVYQLDGAPGGASKEEYWVIPATQTTTIAAVRSKLVPANVAAQFLTRDQAESSYVHAAGDQIVGGAKTFTQPPAVPTPQNPSDAANKAYVDANAASANLASPPAIGSVTPNAVNATVLTAQSVNGELNAATFPGADICQKISNACASGTGHNKVNVPAGNYSCTNTVTFAGYGCEINGQGSGNTFITLTTAGADLIRYYDPSFLTDIAGPNWSGRISGLNLQVNGVGATAIHAGDELNLAIKDVAISCLSSGSNGIWFDNTVGWTERLNVDATVNNCGKGIRFTRNGGTDSFSYSKFKLHLYVSSPPSHPYSQEGIAIEGTPGSYSTHGVGMALSSFEIGMNGDGNSKTFLHLYPNSKLMNSDLNIRSEDDGAGGVLYQLDAASGGGIAGYFWGNTGSWINYYNSAAPMTIVNNGTFSWALGNGLGSDVDLIPLLSASAAQNYGSPNFRFTGRYWRGTFSQDASATMRLGIGAGSIPQPVFSVSIPVIGGNNSVFQWNGTDSLQWNNSNGGSILFQTPVRTSRTYAFPDVGGNGTVAVEDSNNNLNVPGSVSLQSIPGHEYFVSKYASIQAAIDAAYNNGTVLGGAIVVDDRTSPYTGPGWIVRDSVTLKLAATTYTINGTVQYNNGIKNVVAGIISMPGSHIVGAGTSANHGTNINAANGLNADLIATSTVGTGVGANAQWWHWGSMENFHMDGNKAQQTAGNCINLENMGETAVLRAIEAGDCYGDDIRLEGNFATQSEISNITVNSAGQYGVNLDNFQGVGVLRGLSGDSNAVSIVRFNGSQSATLTVLGLKSEEEISGHDPLITIDMPADGSQPAFYLVGGYTYGRVGLNDVIKIVNGRTGAAPFVQVSNFYVDANYTNAVNDTVNSRTFLSGNMNKVPFSYLPTGAYLSGQAFTFAPGTYIQAGTTALTEVFGSNTDSSTMIAAQGNGDGTSYFTGGLKFGIPNRAQYGSTPEMMARMGSRFLGVGQGYDTNTWVFVPIWKTGDSSNRWIGEPNQRWPEVYASDVNTTTATVGTLNVTNCVGCGSTGFKLLTYATNTGTLTGNGADQAIYTYTIPGGTMQAGTGVHCYLKAQRAAGSGSITYRWKFGGTTVSYAAVTSGSSAISTEMEAFNNPGSTTAQLINLSELQIGNSLMAGAVLNTSAAENTANAVNVSVTFNGASTEQIKGVTLKCTVER